jgi:hypothetical protein
VDNSCGSAASGNKTESASGAGTQRLSWPSRIVFLVSSIYFFPTLLAAALEIKGYKRKSEEAWIWMGLGAIFWMGLLVLISLLQHFSK